MSIEKLRADIEDELEEERFQLPMVIKDRLRILRALIDEHESVDPREQQSQKWRVAERLLQSYGESE